MFFKYNLITTSHIETLLEKEENVTLREIMDQEDVLQECKVQSRKLIDFLVRPESMDEMITLITQEPDEQLDERTRYKYSNISCELLTSDVAALNESLSGSETLMNKLYSFLESEKPLNPLLASFFSKTLAKVFSRKTESVFEYLKSKPDFIKLLLNHIETSAIMDLLIRLMTYSEITDMRGKVLEWLNEQTIVQRLVGLIDPAFSEDCHCNAAQALCDMIKDSRQIMSLMQEKAEADPLLKAIESTEVVADLINHMFSGEKKESVFVNGFAVLLALIEIRKQGTANSQVPPMQSQSTLHAENAPQTFSPLFWGSDKPGPVTPLDAARLAKAIDNVLEAVIPQITNFHKLFLSPPTKAPMTLTVGCLDPPLGYTRLELSRLMVALIGTNTHEVENQLSTLRILHVMMDLFFKYSWNNFLHTQVEHAISRILTNPPSVDHVGNKVHPLMDQLLVVYRITEKILEIFKEYNADINEQKAMERGYMGHLTNIANHIAQNAEGGVNSELIKKKLKELSPEHEEEWEKFTSTTLAEINKRNTTPLVCGVTLSTSSEDGDSHSFKGLPFTQEAALQQVQQISNFVGQYCFNEDFNETDDNLTGQLNRLAQTRFHLTDDNMLHRNFDVFERVCREKSYSVSDPDSDEDIWEDKDKEEKAFCFRLRKESEDNSSDSEDDAHVPSTTESAAVANEELKMEIDNQDGWTANFDSVPMEVGSASARNPWESAEQPSSTSDDQESWADFSNFPSFGASTAEGSDEISSTTSVAMETSDPTLSGKFVSNSEVSSTSDNSASLVSNVPVKKESPIASPPDKVMNACIEPPASGDAPASKESEAKVIGASDLGNVENPKDASVCHEKEKCAPSPVQNGPN